MYVKISIELLENPKAHVPKQKDEISLNGNGSKSREIGQSAAKPRTGEGSTTIPLVGVELK